MLVCATQIIPGEWVRQNGGSTAAVTSAGGPGGNNNIAASSETTGNFFLDTDFSVESSKNSHKEGGLAAPAPLDKIAPLDKLRPDVCAQVLGSENSNGEGRKQQSSAGAGHVALSVFDTSDSLRAWYKQVIMWNGATR